MQGSLQTLCSQLWLQIADLYPGPEHWALSLQPNRGSLRAKQMLMERKAPGPLPTSSGPCYKCNLPVEAQGDGGQHLGHCTALGNSAATELRNVSVQCNAMHCTMGDVVQPKRLPCQGLFAHRVGLMTWKPWDQRLILVSPSLTVSSQENRWCLVTKTCVWLFKCPWLIVIVIHKEILGDEKKGYLTVLNFLNIFFLSLSQPEQLQYIS